jgi:hypothetical protein
MHVRCRRNVPQRSLVVPGLITQALPPRARDRASLRCVA